MICAAATGFWASVVARAVARVDAKDERASGLPAARHQHSVSILAYPETCHVLPCSRDYPLPHSIFVSVIGERAACFRKVQAREAASN